MKKTITVIALLAGAVSGYSQGQIYWAGYSGNLRLQTFVAQPGNGGSYSVTYAGVTGHEIVGNTSATLEKPAGTTVYTGALLSGTAYDNELLVGPAGITSVGGTVDGVGLAVYGTIENFKTGANNTGMPVPANQTVQLPTETYFAVGDQVSVAIAAWSSAYPSLAAAVASGVSGVWGISPVEQTTAAGGLTAVPNTGELLPTTLESFSLATTVPEPSTIALGVMGASALLFRRRK